MKKILIGVIALFSFQLFAFTPLWISFKGGSHYPLDPKVFGEVIRMGEYTIVAIDPRSLDYVATRFNAHMGRGMMTHLTKKEAISSIQFEGRESFFQSGYEPEYASVIARQRDPVVEAAITKVEEPMIRSMMEKLSSFATRYHSTPTGIESQNYVKKVWETLANGNPDIKVEFFVHQATKQPSIILTWQGSERSSEAVVLGGHGDSTAGWQGGLSSAPGADDNASGIACLTEAIRVLQAVNFKPKKTVVFISYAAEEVGLVGSSEVAKSFRAKNINVAGVLQLDMTNYAGSKKPIYLITDSSNAAMNQFVGGLIDSYLGIPWELASCGYACSDHASWTKVGYPASYPFETTMREHNPHIHSIRDTLQNMGGSAMHSVPFAQLGVAFAIELGKK